ncbi:hypothetical protein [Roseateles oligotrophus]|uniref:Uncharacterized protein n=1 Tax=Roseateles oligotrophus TaxID=1769250 RepID=A0ABT2YEA0_9BURK|nr:hypothetical protein [Roseateles oligotrophus]MCV2368320.1 hypothetical protein [Roseateles oligotrophus]
MQSLASFDRWLTRRAASTKAAGAGQAVPPQTAKAAIPAQAASATRHLISPWGEALMPMPRRASAARIVRAAHGVRSADWLGLLADESQGYGTQQAWRLALWRAAPSTDVQPQWLSPPVLARPGQSPKALRDAVLEQALQALWQQGWRLQEAFSPDLH